MNNAESLELKSKTIDALPIINHFIDRLDIDKISKCAMPHADSSNHIMPHTSIGMLLRNIIIGRLPVYGFKECMTVYGIAPVLLKNITRVEALVFVFFVALLVQSVIEREIRLNMKEAGLKNIPIYPEKRECASPTMDKVLNLFSNLQHHYLTDSGVRVKTFNPKLNDVQAMVLDLLGMSKSVYTGES